MSEASKRALRRRLRLRAKGICDCCGQRKASRGLNRCAGCRDRFNQKSAASRAKFKAQVIAHYGGACNCCGETEPVFLSVHVHGNGKAHRKAEPNARFMWRWLVVHNFPDGYRVLCFNCNFATSGGRICPHQLRGV